MTYKNSRDKTSVMKWRREHPEEAKQINDRDRMRRAIYCNRRYQRLRAKKTCYIPKTRQEEIEAWHESQVLYPNATYEEFRKWWKQIGGWNKVLI